MCPSSVFKFFWLKQFCCGPPGSSKSQLFLAINVQHTPAWTTMQSKFKFKVLHSDFVLKVGRMLNDMFNFNENSSFLLHRTHNLHKIAKLSIRLVYYFRLQPCSRVLHLLKDSELQSALSGANAHRQNSVLYWQWKQHSGQISRVQDLRYSQCKDLDCGLLHNDTM